MRFLAISLFRLSQKPIIPGSKRGWPQSAKCLTPCAPCAFSMCFPCAKNKFITVLHCLKLRVISTGNLSVFSRFEVSFSSILTTFFLVHQNKIKPQNGAQLNQHILSFHWRPYCLKFHVHQLLSMCRPCAPCAPCACGHPAND